MSIKVKFISEVEVKDGKKTLKAAKNANIKINGSCDGKGKCGKCVIKVLNGKLSEPTKQELKVLGQEKIDQGYRLVCQTQILEDSVIQIINDDTEIKDKEENTNDKAEIKDNKNGKINEENTENKNETKESKKAKAEGKNTDNKVKAEKENAHNKVEIKENKKAKVKDENTDNRIEAKEDNTYNKAETKDNKKTKSKKSNVDNEVKSKEDAKVLVKMNRKTSK